MNRNMMYELLQEKGLKNLMVRRTKNKYHFKFVLDADSDQFDWDIITEWGYIRHVDSVHLCRDEIVVESKYGDMKVNMFYKNIKKFDVRVYSYE